MTKRSTIVIVSGLIVFCLILSLVLVRHYRTSEAQHTQHYNVVPFGPNPDFKKIGQNQDNAYMAVVQKEQQIQLECNNLRLSDAEVKRRITAVREIGHAELDRVRATGYTQPFNPDVWKQLPADMNVPYVPKK